MIKIVETKKDLKGFIYFIKYLYKGETHYVFPIFSALIKELTEIVLKKKTYIALLSIRDGEIQGRLLFTYSHNKKRDEKICYFSFFDTINDLSVVKELFEKMEEIMKSEGVKYSEGVYAPYDPDTRRGVLISGFDIDPTIFTSYNYEYYGSFLESIGYTKAIDTVSLNADVSQKSKKRLNTISKYFSRSNDVRVDPINWKELDRDMEDVHQILIAATNEIIYQDAPSIDVIAETAKSMKAFINPNLIRIARENKTNKPIGFCLVLPDFNQVFKKTKGKIRPIRMMLLKKKITKARGTMQYIIPEYQNTGLIGHIFKVIFDELELLGVTDFEAGTMMENNPKPINAFKKFGGEIIKTYRIYGKEID
jgi:hypothetical protein